MMTVLHWCGSWQGWLLLVLVSTSIHLTGSIAYQAGQRNAPRRQVEAIVQILERMDMHHGNR